MIGRDEEVQSINHVVAALNPLARCTTQPQSMDLIRQTVALSEPDAAAPSGRLLTLLTLLLPHLDKLRLKACCVEYSLRICEGIGLSDCLQDALQLSDRRLWAEKDAAPAKRSSMLHHA